MLHIDVMVLHSDVTLLQLRWVQTCSVTPLCNAIANKCGWVDCKCKASYIRARWMVRKPLANQMRVCVDGAANLCCAIREQFAYRSPQTGICRVFAQTQRELDMPGVLCSLQVYGKLINCAPLRHCTRTAQRVSGALVYTELNSITSVCVTL